MEPAVRLELDKMRNRIATLEDGHKEILTAFPNADIDGHKRYHELMIEQIMDRKKLIRLLTEKTLIGILWTGIVFIATLLIHGFHDTVYNWLHDGPPPPPPASTSK